MSKRSSNGHAEGMSTAPACAAALQAAERRCLARGARLTEGRRAVLRAVLEADQPLGAYDILERLAADDMRVQPPTVYRALEFLQTHGLVHRVESRNAFIACGRGAAPHAPQFLICRRCGTAAELHDPDIEAAILRAGAKAGFTIDVSPVVEISGVCGSCERVGHDDARR